MAEVIKDEIEPIDEPLTWWNKWKVPAAPLILGMAILAGAIAYGFAQIEWNRDAAASALAHSACESQAEFRGFFTEYLKAQIGTPVEEIPGFDQLSPEAKEFAIQLAPVVEAGRERDEAYLAAYMIKFPIPNCDDL